MKLKDILKHFGTQQEAANAIGVEQATVSRWINGIPFTRQCQIQLLTGGKLVAKEFDSPKQPV